jgi:hypothetical protein
MFAGVGKGTRLLAVGVPTNVDGTDADVDKHGSIEITADTKKITFTLSALTTDTVGGVSFTVDGESIPWGAYVLDGEDVPYFWVPSYEGEIEGTFKIGGFTSVAGGVPDDGDLFNTTGLFGALSAVGSTTIIQAIGTPADDPVTGKFVPPLAVGGEVKEIGIAGGELAIGFELATDVISTLTAGFSTLWFDVPIQAFTAGSEAAGRGHVWHIVNGLAAVWDMGAAKDSAGENLLLYTGEPYYVSASGDDDNNNGMTEDKPFATLAKAYAAAKDNPLCREIIVLTDLADSAIVMIDGSGAANTNVITIKGKTGAETLTRSSGTNASVIQIQSGAKVSFRRITVDGKYSDPVYNRGLFVTGAGTEVTIGTKAAISGKLIRYSNGGGVYVTGGARLTMTGGKISDSTVNTDDWDEINYGGGVYVVSGGSFTMSGGEISNNTVSGEWTGYGGGVAVGSGGSFTMSGGEISNNAIGWAYYGGGVAVVNGGSFTMEGGKISDNTTANNGKGGGVAVVNGGSWFTMEGGEISDNTAKNSGGGVAVGSGGGFTMEGGKISHNTAWNGGGVNMEYGNSWFTMEGGEISDNTANSDANGGGGVMVFTASTFTMHNGKISGNTPGYGGGVAMWNATFTMWGGVIYGNEKSTANNGGVAFYKANSTAQWNQNKDGVLVNLDTTNDTLDLQ